MAVALSMRCLLLFAEIERNERFDDAEQSVKQPNIGLRNMPSNETELLPYQFGLFRNFTKRMALVSLVLLHFKRQLLLTLNCSSFAVMFVPP